MGKFKGNEYDGAPRWNVKLKAESAVVLGLLVDLKPLVMCIIDSLMASESFFICFEQNHVFRPPIGPDQISFITVVGVEVEDVNEFSLFVDNDLVFFA